MKKLLLILLLINSFAFAQVGIGNTDPKTSLDVTGGLSLREGATLNITAATTNNLSLGTTPSSFYRITGPTAAFSITGLAPATSADGQIITIENTTAFTLTIVHDAASSIAVNRIYCPGGTNLILSGQYSTVTLSYNASQLHWVIIGSTDNAYGKNIQSTIGTTDITINSTTFADMAEMTTTFTPKHNVVYVNFSASGDVGGLGNDPQEYIEFKLLKDGVRVGGTVTTGTDSDDLGGAVAAWNAHFTMYPVSVTAGTSTTIKIQWMRDGITPQAARNRIVTNPDYSHRSLTIFD